MNVVIRHSTNSQSQLVKTASCKVLLVGDVPLSCKKEFLEHLCTEVLESGIMTTRCIDSDENICVKVKVQDLTYLKLNFMILEDKSLKLFHQSTEMCVILFDEANMESFRNVIEWKREIDGIREGTAQPQIPCILGAVQFGERRLIMSLDEVCRVMEKYNFIGYTHLLFNGEYPCGVRKILDFTVRYIFNELDMGEMNDKAREKLTRIIFLNHRYDNYPSNYDSEPESESNQLETPENQLIDEASSSWDVNCCRCC